MKNFEEVIAVVTVLNRILALRNFEQPKNCIKYLCTWIYNIVVLCVFSTMAMLFEIYHLRQFLYSIEQMVYAFLIFAYFVAIMGMVSLGWYHSKDALELRKQIAEADEKLRKLGLIVDCGGVFRHTVIVGFVWLVNTLLSSGCYLHWLKAQQIGQLDILLFVSYFYLLNIGPFILYDFTICIYWLGVRFKEIDELLGEILVKGRPAKIEKHGNSVIDELTRNFRQFHSNGRSLFDTARRSKIFPQQFTSSLIHERKCIKTMLQQIRAMHLRLCDISKLVNKVYNNQVVLHSSVTLLYFTISLYYMYMEIQKSKRGMGGVQLNLVTISIVDAITNYMKIAITSYDCEYTMKQANKMVETVHECSLHRVDKELIDEILQFSLQISHTQLGRTKAVSFRLNYGYIRDCASFVTTYLVIMIQWSQNAISKETSLIANRTAQL